MKEHIQKLTILQSMASPDTSYTIKYLMYFAQNVKTDKSLIQIRVASQTYSTGKFLTKGNKETRASCLSFNMLMYINFRFIIIIALILLPRLSRAIFLKYFSKWIRMVDNI